MTSCPACSRALPDDALSCSACGAALVESATPTRQHLAEAPKRQDATPAHPPDRQTPRLDWAEAIEGRFIAGAMLAGRYRIIGLIGKGGMGEVYKAEDLKLKQTVALKFLPEALALDGGALARFHNEVRIARQVAHPNVCRVYDIGEVEGLHFLSMEFIDGEDLSSLLRRIGRLPGDKAVELARQMCAGLAAAHEGGVLHRDLKPANVMIDGRGKARITDFGLAVVTEELRGDDVIAGTPAYMAPEQLTGKEVTQRSDIYSLGLVLYELFTGKRVYETQSTHELIALHEKSAPPTPSSHVKDIDPLAERVILRCLEKDPKARPASAVQVALALPGGDPLQAALAMGETPSPEMVAASGEKTGLRPAVGLACLGAVIIGLFLAVWINSKVSLIERVPLETPDALARKAREISARLGYTDPPKDTAYGLAYSTNYLNYAVKNDPSSERWDHLQYPAVVFNYREGPEYIEFVSDLNSQRFIPSPPHSGMVFVTLDPQGRLLSFRADPPPTDDAAASAFDWGVLFQAGGLELARFTPVEPQWTPASAFDLRASWTGTATGTAPDQSSVPFRIEAAAWRGKPVFFLVIYQWTPIGRETSSSLPGFVLFDAILYVAILIGATLVTRSNYRRGRGDRKGALKLSCLIFSLVLLVRILAAHAVPNLRSLTNDLLRSISVSLFWAAFLWVCYFAFEPFVRRYWPASIISWSRVLAGQARDAVVGRDVLIGVMTGTGLFVLAGTFSYLAGYRFELAPTTLTALGPLIGIRGVAVYFPSLLLIALIVSIETLALLFLLRVLLRRQWLAVGVAILLAAAGAPQVSYWPVAGFPTMIVFSAMMVFVATRFGLIALAAAALAYCFLQGFPLTLNFSAWYFGIGLIGPLIVLALALYGFYTSLGGQRVFQGSLLED